MKTILVGGKNKQLLLSELADRGIELNEAARILFSSDLFVTAATEASVAIVQLSVRQLGLPQGGTMAQLQEKAEALGLALAPLALGPQLRLQYLDQPEGCWGHPVTKHRAPPGSLTIASARLSADDGFPRGFYLRRIEGVLWLRGYWCDDANVWNPDDRLVFRKP